MDSVGMGAGPGIAHHSCHRGLDVHPLYCTGCRYAELVYDSGDIVVPP